MIQVRKSAERGEADFGWLKSRHTFSFGSYQDPRQMGFGPLRVINEDRVAGGAGFDPHPHRDMEIISVVLEGGLSHEDSGGNAGVIRPGDVQAMSAGRGIVHSEFNASADELVHFLQIWIQPAERGLPPRYDQRAFPPAERRDRLRLVVSPDGADGSLPIAQDARMFLATLSAGSELSHAIAEGRRAWLQVARGRVEVAGELLEAGDGAAVEADCVLDLRAPEESEIVLFDLP